MHLGLRKHTVRCLGGRGSLLLPCGALVVACGGAGVRGATPRLPQPADTQGLQSVFTIDSCADAIGQPLPARSERIALYREGTTQTLVSKPLGLIPVVIENKLRAGDVYKFQMVAGNQLLEVQLPEADDTRGHWLLASHWQEWEQAEGFGARPLRVVERCAVTRAAPPKGGAPESVAVVQEGRSASVPVPAVGDATGQPTNTQKNPPF